MNTKLSLKFAKKNILANKIFTMPFFISASLMTALWSIMYSLSKNQYVNTAHESLPDFINFGVFIVGFFTTLFIIYSNKYLVKRRYKEFALYSIMGLENKHIKKIIRAEFAIIFLIVFAVSTLGGYVLGKLMFLMANYLTNASDASLSHYSLTFKTVRANFFYCLFNYVILYIINSKTVSTVTPISLITKSKKGEKEPKSRYLITILGLGLLAVGYCLAFITKGNLKSLGMFFVAAFLVIVATYLLFVSLSINILKSLKKNKNYYYRPKHFINISQMLYRMKSNALGLGSIAILCTAVIITISVTYTIFANMNNILKTTFPNEFVLMSEKNTDLMADEDEINSKIKEIKNLVSSKETTNLTIAKNVYTMAKKKGNALYPMNKDVDKSDLSCILLLSDIDSYNAETRQNISLKDDEVLMYSNSKRMQRQKSLELNGKTYRVRLEPMYLMSSMSIEIYRVILPSTELLQNLGKYYKNLDFETRKFQQSNISFLARWDVNQENKDYISNLKAKIDPKEYTFKSRKSMKDTLNDINGGFLFLGIVVAAIFLTGTILITYYKQVCEGYEDRRNYQIMKKVGLPDTMILDCARSQIVWMFFVPLIVALSHCLISSKIIYNFLELFGVSSYFSYGKNIFIITAIFAGIYYGIFKITSNIYWKIVK